MNCIALASQAIEAAGEARKSHMDVHAWQGNLKQSKTNTACIVCCSMAAKPALKDSEMLETLINQQKEWT